MADYKQFAVEHNGRGRMEGHDVYLALLESRSKPRLCSQRSMCCHLLAPAGLSQSCSDGLQSQIRHSKVSIPEKKKNSEFSLALVEHFEKCGSRWKGRRAKLRGGRYSINVNARRLCREKTMYLG